MAVWKRATVLLAVLLMLAVPARAADTVLAECWQGLSADNVQWQECPLGDYTADAVRAGTQAQIALIPAELLDSTLVGDGAITEADLQASIPRDCGVQVCTLSGPELKALLEDSASRWTLTERETLAPEASVYGGYLQISGCSVTLDASAPAGDRVVSVAVDGEPVPLEDEGWSVTAAIPDTLGISGDQASGSLRDMVRNYMVSEGAIALPEGERVRVIGAHQREIISYFPPGMIGVLVVIFALAGVLSMRRKQAY